MWLNVFSWWMLWFWFTRCEEQSEFGTFPTASSPPTVPWSINICLDPESTCYCRSLKHYTSSSNIQKPRYLPSFSGDSVCGRDVRLAMDYPVFVSLNVSSYSCPPSWRENRCMCPFVLLFWKGTEWLLLKPATRSCFYLEWGGIVCFVFFSTILKMKFLNVFQKDAACRAISMTVDCS